MSLKRRLVKSDTDDEMVEPSSYAFLNSWSHTLRALVFVFSVFAMILMSILIGIKIIGQYGVKIDKTKSGTSIVFSSFGNEKSQYQSVIVHPRGWNDPGIEIKAGDVIRIDATGSVQLAAGLLNIALRNQYTFRCKQSEFEETDPRYCEKRINVPEMEIEEVKASLSSIKWNAPDGFTYTDVENGSVASSHKDGKKYLMDPEGLHGQLLMAVTTKEECNIKKLKDTGKVKHVGETSYQYARYEKGMEVEAQLNGKLCFFVNDQVSNDPYRNGLLSDDNLGVFGVNIYINRANKT